VAQLAYHGSATFNPVVAGAALLRRLRFVRDNVRCALSLRVIFRHRCIDHSDEVGGVTRGEKGAISGRRAVQGAPVVSPSCHILHTLIFE